MLAFIPSSLWKPLGQYLFKKNLDVILPYMSQENLMLYNLQMMLLMVQKSHKQPPGMEQTPIGTTGWEDRHRTWGLILPHFERCLVWGFFEVGFRCLFFWCIWSNYSDLTPPGPPKGSWEREFPFWFRDIQVGERWSIWPECIFWLPSSNNGPMKVYRDSLLILVVTIGPLDLGIISTFQIAW